jgi:pseudouridine synthase
MPNQDTDNRRRGGGPARGRGARGAGPAPAGSTVPPKKRRGPPTAASLPPPGPSFQSTTRKPERLERLQKVLARAGVASRRAAEQMIVDGRVRVGDAVVRELGTKVDPAVDQVRVDGRLIQVLPQDAQERMYFLLNKPAGFLTTTKDDRGRKTVMDLVKGASLGRIYPVGRLDYDAEGALLLTNDGELANLLTHPRYHVPKTYMAKVKGTPTEEQLDKLRRGITLEDGPTKPAHVEVVEKARVNTWVEITVTEGRNRLIKRMFWRIQHPVLKLVRTRFGALDTDGLRLGEYRELDKSELVRLRALLDG